MLDGKDHPSISGADDPGVEARAYQSTNPTDGTLIRTPRRPFYRTRRGVIIIIMTFFVIVAAIVGGRHFSTSSGPGTTQLPPEILSIPSGEIVDTYDFGVLNLQLLKTSSVCAQHPTITLSAPAGAVILGGGAYVDWSDGPCAPPSPPGNLLTAMYPNEKGTTWTVASKDHFQVNMATVTAYCIIAKMKNGKPISSENYTVVSGTSNKAGQPTLQVDVPPGFIVVGGGARADYTGVGNMLFASYPAVGLAGWVGSAKDHLQSDPATITVWAIGLRESFLSQAGMNVSSLNATSSPAVNHPSKAFDVPNFYLTGVGARVNWHGVGSLLTSSFPKDRRTVVAEGKDHLEADPSTITAYAVGFQG